MLVERSREGGTAPAMPLGALSWPWPAFLSCSLVKVARTSLSQLSLTLGISPNQNNPNPRFTRRIAGALTQSESNDSTRWWWVRSAIVWWFKWKITKIERKRWCSKWGSKRRKEKATSRRNAVTAGKAAREEKTRLNYCFALKMGCVRFDVRNYVTCSLRTVDKSSFDDFRKLCGLIRLFLFC